VEKRAKFIRLATLAFGIPFSLYLTFSFYYDYQIRSPGVYLLLEAWVFGGSYALAWVFWVLLEKPRLEDEDRAK
jgi:hypothetical protein